MASSFTLDYQKAFLYLVIQDKDFSNHINNIPMDIFEGSNYGLVFGAIQDLFRRGRRFTFTSIQQEVKTKYQEDPLTYKELVKCLKRVKKYKSRIKDFDTQDIYERLTEAIRSENMKSSIAEASLYLEQGDLRQAENCVLSSLNESILPNLESYLYFTTVSKRYNKILKQLKDDGTFRVFKTMIPAVDRHLHRGGFLETQLALIEGKPNAGKSMLMTFFAKNFIIQKYNVLHVTLEMAADEIAERYDTMFSGIPTEDLFDKPKLTMRKLLKAYRSFGNHLCIAELPPYMSNINNIRSIIEVQRIHGFKPDVIVVDGADYLMPSMKNVKYDSYWTSGIPYAELKGLGVSERIFVLADAQANRGSGSESMEEALTMESLAHSYLRGMVASTVLSINQTSRELKEKRLRLFFAKQREGKKFIYVPLRFQDDIYKYSYDNQNQKP